jgi:urease accessory protein UreH
MEAGSCAIISDALAVGRLARGERWGFQEIVNQITVSSKGRSAFLERMRLVPAEMIPAALGGMEEFGYLATLVLVADSFGKWESVARALNELLTSAVSVLGGVSQISCGGCVVRFLAASAHDLTQMIRDLWSLARLLMLGLPAADLRKF